MPPATAQTQPSQVNPALVQALRQRAMAALQAQGGGGAPAPNSMNAPVPGSPQPTPNNVARRPGGANPAQAVMKAAAQAQSPLLDPETRNIAKSLIQKLMQHI